MNTHFIWWIPCVDEDEEKNQQKNDSGEREPIV